MVDLYRHLEDKGLIDGVYPVELMAALRKK